MPTAGTWVGVSATVAWRWQRRRWWWWTFTFQLVLRHIAGNTGVQYVTRVPPRVSTQSVAQGNRPRVWLTQLRLFPSSLPSRLKQNKLVWLGNVEDIRFCCCSCRRCSCCCCCCFFCSIFQPLVVDLAWLPRGETRGLSNTGTFWTTYG